MGQVKPLDYTVTSFAPFAPEHITQRDGHELRSAGSRTLQLAVPAGWTAEGACVGNWAPFDSEHLWQRAKAICAGCPVRDACLEAALVEETATGIRFGVRGGLTASERARLDNENTGDVA